MSRIVVMELLQALKFKSPLPDTNLLLLVQVPHTLFHGLRCACGELDVTQGTESVVAVLFVQFVCADIGTRLAESTIIQKHMISSLPVVKPSSQGLFP